MCAAYSLWGRHPDRGANCTPILPTPSSDGVSVGAVFSAKPSEGPARLARLFLRAGDIASLPGPVSRCRESMNSLFGLNNDCFIARCAGGGDLWPLPVGVAELVAWWAGRLAGRRAPN